MSDQRRQLRDERRKEEAIAQVLERGVADYSRAAEHRAELRKTLFFAVSDPEVLAPIFDRIEQMWDALNECVPGTIRQTYEARKASRNEEVTGGRVM